MKMKSILANNFKAVIHALCIALKELEHPLEITQEDIDMNSGRYTIEEAFDGEIWTLTLVSRDN